MNEIIDMLCNIKINKDCNHLDSLIDQFENNSLLNPQQEWKNLQNNYSKLRYLKKVGSIKELNFEKPFKKFMDVIVKQNKYYLENILLDPEYYTQEEHYFKNIDLASLKEIINSIYCFLDTTLQTNDPYVILDNTISAYKHLITLAEDVRGDYYTEYIEPDFIETFKKRKLNK
jgi:hypothetical protein